MPAKRKTARRAVKKAAPRKAATKAKRPAPRRPAPKPRRAATPKRAAAPKRAATPNRATRSKASAPPKRPAVKRPATRRAATRRAAPPRRKPAATRTRGATRRPRPRADFTPPPRPKIAAEPEQADNEAWPEEAFRPAVRGETTTVFEAEPDAAVPAWGLPEEPERARTTDTYGEDVPIAIVSAALAASTFLPWYEGQSGVDATVSAWSSGTWGPIMFFLGIGSLALVLLRRSGVRLSLPFEEALLHELAGWLALAGGVIKSRYRPGPEGLLGISWGLWVGLVSAFLLAFLAGRMAPQAPLVRRPRWYREKGGAVAAAVLLVVIAGSAVFGSINEMEPLGFTPTTPSGELPGLVRGKLPDCAEGFPVPSIVRPVQGVEQPCQAHLQSDRPPAEVVAALRQSLQSAGWTATVGETGGTTTLNITSPKCATAAVVGADQGSVAVVAFGICASATPTASPT